MSFGSLEETGEYAEGLETVLGARAKKDFAEDDHGAQGLLGVVIGWRHAYLS